MLSLRLKEIADFVEENASIINVGTDHALLEIYLAKTKNVKSVGIDILDYSVNQSIENVKSANLEESIKIIKNDGLKNIKINDEIIMLSGLGTKTILNILNQVRNNDLIIQSNNDLFILRKKIVRKGYYILKEKAIYDKRWYVIIYFKKGKQKYTSFKLYLGPKIKNKDYIHYLIKINEKKYRNIPKNKFIKRFKTKRLIMKLKNCR